MKALLAVGNEHVSKNIADRYFEKYGETLDYKTVFYFKSIVDTIREDKSYDVLVIQEESMEQYKAKTIEQIDSEIYGYVDTITDEIQDTEIIYIGGERRTRDDKFILRLFNIGIYNILLGDDRSLNTLCDVIKKPRNKRDAKEYLKIESGSFIDTGVMRDDEVDEAQMMNILNYYDRYRDEPDKWVEIFDNIASQYNRTQLKIIFYSLPKSVQPVIAQEPKYKFLMINDNNKVVEKQETDWNQNAKKIEKKLSKDFFGAFRKKNKSEDKVQPIQVETQKQSIETQENQRKQITQEERVKEEERKQILSNKAWQDVEERSKKLHEREEELKKAQEEAEREQRENIAQTSQVSEPQIEEQTQQALREQALKEQQEREQALREQALKEQQEREQALKEQQEREQAQKEQETKQQALREQALKEQEARQQALREQALKEQEARQRELQEKEKREQELQSKLNQTVDVEPIKVEKFDTNENCGVDIPPMRYLDNEVLDSRTLEEQKKMKAEQDRIKQEQEKIRRLQEELEEEKKRIREEQSRLASERNQIEVRDTAPQRTYESTPVIPIDYKKTVAFVGANKVGTSFLVNAVAFNLSKQKIVTGILDMTKDKSMYYIYNQNDRNAMEIASVCMKELSEGQEKFIPVSKYLKVYTSIPSGASDNRRGLKHKNIIETVKNSNNITIIDADFSTPIDYFEQASEIYLIQDMDILKIQDATLFLREMKSRNLDMNKIKIIINKYIKSSLSCNTIIRGLSSYKDPEMTFIDTILTKRIDSFVVTYNSNNYIKYVEALSNGTMNFKGYTPEFEEEIQKIANSVYVLSKKKKSGLFG